MPHASPARHAFPGHTESKAVPFLENLEGERTPHAPQVRIHLGTRSEASVRSFRRTVDLLHWGSNGRAPSQSRVREPQDDRQLPLQPRRRTSKDCRPASEALRSAGPAIRTQRSGASLVSSPAVQDRSARPSIHPAIPPAENGCLKPPTPTGRGREPTLD
jgi:hypothetical protein